MKKKLELLKAKFRTIDFKEKKYALPLIAFPFVIFVAYQVYALVTNDYSEADRLRETSYLNDELPEAKTDDKSRNDNLNEYWEGDGYTAVGELEKDSVQRLETNDPYTLHEKNRLDSIAAAKKYEEIRAKALRQSYSAGNRTASPNPPPAPAMAGTGKTFPSYTYPENTASNGAVRAAADYAAEIRRIQKQLRGEDEEDERARPGRTAADERLAALTGKERSELEALRAEKARRDSVRTVQKAESENMGLFHSVGEKDPEDALIRAMLDQTLKVTDGTRLRLKLLDDVTIDSTLLRKGTYLYALVDGFKGQRVMASVSSILLGNKFIRVSLSLYDNDGMEGFYVPESSFRELVRNAEASALQGGNMSMGGNYGGSSLNAETMALQTIQNMYQGTAQAIAGNIRKNRAKIKYNTVVYLINSKQ